MKRNELARRYAEPAEPTNTGMLGWKHTESYIQNTHTSLKCSGEGGGGGAKRAYPPWEGRSFRSCPGGPKLHCVTVYLVLNNFSFLRKESCPYIFLYLDLYLQMKIDDGFWRTELELEPSYFKKIVSVRLLYLPSDDKFWNRALCRTQEPSQKEWQVIPCREALFCAFPPRMSLGPFHQGWDGIPLIQIRSLFDTNKFIPRVPPRLRSKNFFRFFLKKTSFLNLSLPHFACSALSSKFLSADGTLFHQGCPWDGMGWDGMGWDTTDSNPILIWHK